MPEFIHLIHPLRHEFFVNPTPQEETAMEAHFDYLKQATSDGFRRLQTAKYYWLVHAWMRLSGLWF